MAAVTWFGRARLLLGRDPPPEPPPPEGSAPPPLSRIQRSIRVAICSGVEVVVTIVVFCC